MKIKTDLSDKEIEDLILMLDATENSLTLAINYISGSFEKRTCQETQIEAKSLVDKYIEK